jgi:HrpA-like RNA helicase
LQIEIQSKDYFTSPNLAVFGLHGNMMHEEQLKALLPAESKTRKVIVATDFAESSIDIPNIVYVIDCGFSTVAFG